MKYLNQLLHPSTWSFTVQLSAAMLLIACVPFTIVACYPVMIQNRQSVLVIGTTATLVILLLARSLVKPIRLLAKAARSLEQGNFAPQMLIKLSNRCNDVGYLARVLMQLATRLKAVQEQQVRQETTEVLLQELSNRDLDWLIETGHYGELPSGTTLIQEGGTIGAFHIILDGTLAVTVSHFSGNYLECPSAAKDPKLAGWQIAELSSGEVVGEQYLFDSNSTATTTIQALNSASVLSIPYAQLTTKLKQDVEFAAHFYRAIAMMLSDRFQNFVSQIGFNSLSQEQPLRDVLFMLGALNDSDIDWLVAIGQRRTIPANTILIRQGRPVDALYLLLNGTLAISTADDVCNPFVRAFSISENDRMPGQEIARLAKGEIVGETPFLNAHLPPATVTALQDSIVLAIPRRHLAIQLQQDVGFAARFYRVLASLLFSRLQEVRDRLNQGEQIDQSSHSLNGKIQADELSFGVLDRMALASTRFDWMLRRLGGIEPV